MTSFEPRPLMPLRTSHPARLLLLPLIMAVAIALPAFGEQFIVTGTYTGDGLNPRSITGVGFQPDLVIVKGALDESAYCKTATMAGAHSKSLGPGEGTKTDRITALVADGFSVADTKEVNEAGVVYTWVAMKASSGLMTLGSYVGDGSPSRFIDGAAFTPETVLVMTEDSKVAVLRSVTMPISESLALAGGRTWSNRILDTVVGGFQVGSADEVNKKDKAYHFVAWNAAEDITAVGDYTGDGNANRSIAGAGFNPAWILLASEDETSAVQRTAALGAGDVTQYFNKTGNSGGLITGLAADGFVVGAADDANAAGSHFNWLALRQPTNQVDLGLTAAATPVAPAVGDTVRVTHTLTSVTGLDATNIAVTTGHDPGLDFESATASAGTYTPGPGIWDVGTMTGGAVESLVLVYTVASGQEGRQLTCTARISAVDQSDPIPGNDQATTAVTVVEPPSTGDLEASYVNFPNPFAAGREQTTFAFDLVEDGRVTLKVHTPHGELVATVIDNEDRAAGFHQSDTWDGRNSQGETVRNGVFLAEIVVEFANGTRARFLRKVAVVR